MLPSTYEASFRSRKTLLWIKEPQKSMKTKQDKLNLLEETATFYTSENRCVWSKGLSACQYYTKDIPHGCAIGRLIPDKTLCKQLNSWGGVCNTPTFNLLPPDLQEYGQSFLSELQRLHDGEYNWNMSGLSLTGIRFVQEIREQIEADMI